MAWFLIVAAGLFETGFAVLLKQSAHFTRLWPTDGFATCALVSFGLLSLALRGLEVGPAYPSGPASVRRAPPRSGWPSWVTPCLRPSWCRSA